MSYLQRAGEWFAFCTNRGRYCRRVTLYDEMEWDSDVAFDACTDIALAPLGGPVAVAPRHVNEVVVYSNSGRFIKRFALPLDAGYVLRVGWSREEHVVVLTNKYHVLVFELAAQPATMGGNVAPAHTLKLAPNSTAPPAIVEMRPWGVFTIDANATIRAVVFEERRDPEKVELPIAEHITCTPSALEILPKELSEDGETTLFIAPGTDDENLGTIFAVSLASSEVKDLDLDIVSGVAALRMRNDGNEIAMYTHDGRLLIAPADFSAIKFCFAVGASVPPLSLHWCGADFVYMTFSRSQVDELDDASHFAMLVPCIPRVETKFELLPWDADGCGLTATVAEVDGVRIVTETGCYFIENLPQCLTRLFQLKSTAPTAAVADAYQDFIGDNVRGIVTMRRLASTLGAEFADVVDELVDAASSEFELTQQEQVLAVAAFAKSFCANYDADRYVDSMKRIRVLNAVRGPSCGVALTLRQYQTLSGADQLRHLSPSEAQVLVDRLVNRHEFQLAYDVATLLNMRVEKVLVRWSCVKVQQPSLLDSEIRASIAKVLGQCAGASFTDAALMAYRAGRQQLAIQLLHDEPRSQNKVMLFLQMRQDELALRMAAESNDPDLIHLVLIKVINTLSPQGTVNLLMRMPEAQRLLAHAATVFTMWRRPVSLLHEDTHQTHLTACTKLEALLRHQDTLFLDMLTDETRTGGGGGGGGAGHDDDAAAADAAVAAAAAAAEAEKQGKKGGLWSKLKGTSAKKKSAADALLETVSKAKEAEEARTKAAAARAAAAKEAAPSVARVIELLEEADTEYVPLPRREAIQGTRAVTGSDLIGITNLFAESTKPACDSAARMLKLHSELLTEQERLAELSGDDSFLNASVVETVRLCFEHGMEKQAEAVRVKFNLPDKKFWFVKLAALCTARNWDAVDKLGGGGKYSKVKSPIGFLPFVEILAANQREEQAAVFVARLPDLYDRVEWYVKLDNFQKAIDDAFNDENVELIEQIRKKASNPSTIEYANKRIKALE